MTTKEARLLLKEIGTQLADNEIELILANFNAIIDMGLEKFEKENINAFIYK